MYFLLEPWEIDEIKTRFEGQQTLGVFTRPPRAMYQEPGRLYFFDAAADASRNTPAEIVTGTERGLLAALPAPRPRLVFR